MNQSKRYSLREWLIVKLGGITKSEWKAEFDRHRITTPVKVSKYRVTFDIVLPPGVGADEIPTIVKARLAAKLADGLMESGAVQIEPYQYNIVHTREEQRNMRYVATLYICEKE